LLKHVERNIASELLLTLLLHWVEEANSRLDIKHLIFSLLQ